MYAETNVMGEEIIIYDDNFKAAPSESNGDLSNKGLEAKDIYNNNFGLSNSTSKKLGNGQFDDTLESSTQTLDNDQTEVISSVNDDLW
ncbi:MAG TPA: hypothetical protein VES38_12590, partial [Methylotenera sp.]|nr:hypothetical protein [Methylotenera sp.]